MSSFFKTILNNPSGVYGIWKMKAPPRVLVFGWLALKEKDPYYGSFEEERDEDSVWMPNVLEGRRIPGPSLY